MKNMLSQNIEKNDLKEMIKCFTPEVRSYGPKETIMCYSDKIEKIGIVLVGRAQLHWLDMDGEYKLLETYVSQDVFGELFYFPLENYEYIVEATEYTRVMFINYDHIIRPCKNTCQCHIQLIDNLFYMTAKKAQQLSLHLNVLSQKNIRKKLMTYLKYTKETERSNPFKIPMSLVSLAEYLCVDRSAMMREIKSLKKEGILSSERQTFTLL